MIGSLGRISATVSFLIGGLGILSIMILIVMSGGWKSASAAVVQESRHHPAFLLESSFISLCGAWGVLFRFVVSVCF